MAPRLFCSSISWQLKAIVRLVLIADDINLIRTYLTIPRGRDRGGFGPEREAVSVA